MTENATAVQAVDELPAPEDLSEPTEEAGHNVEKDDADAEEADPTRPWHNCDSIQVQDLFCLDNQYLQQLPTPQAPLNQCSFFGKTFGSEKALTNHIGKDHN